MDEKGKYLPGCAAGARGHRWSCFQWHIPDPRLSLSYSTVGADPYGYRLLQLSENQDFLIIIYFSQGKR